MLKTRFAREGSALMVVTLLLTWTFGETTTPFPQFGYGSEVPVQTIAPVLAAIGIMLWLTPRSSPRREVLSQRPLRWAEIGLALALVVLYGACVALVTWGDIESVAAGLRNAGGFLGLLLILRRSGLAHLAVLVTLGNALALLAFAGVVEGTPLGWPLAPADDGLASATASGALLLGLWVGTGTPALRAIARAA